jgi:hypothetical protein
MAHTTLSLEKGKNIQGDDLLRELPQLGSCELAGVYATPKKLCFNRESLMNVLGSFGSACETTVVLVVVPSPLPVLLLLDDERLLPL